MRNNLIKGMLILGLLFTPLFPAVAAEGAPLLVDEADLLTGEEEIELREQLEEISRRQACDVAVVTVDALGGKTAEAYADDFYDTNGYGQGAELDGILLLVSMEERDWAISTHGYGITAFTDAGLAYLSEEVLLYLSDGEYADAFAEYAVQCDDFLTQAKTGEPYDGDNMPDSGGFGLLIGLALALGFLLAFGIGMIERSKMKTVAVQASANAYAKEGSTELTVKQDRLINVIRTSRKIETDTGGGSTTHKSAGGRTHGGASGKF